MAVGGLNYFGRRKRKRRFEKRKLTVNQQVEVEIPLFVFFFPNVCVRSSPIFFVFFVILKIQGLWEFRFLCFLSSFVARFEKKKKEGSISVFSLKSHYLCWFCNE